jgi:hypothetical protein
MIYQIKNPLTDEFEYYDNAGLARATLAKNKSDYLEQEKTKFPICKVIVSGNDEIWSTADLDNDPEDTKYKVFNQYTGQHETCGSRTLAKNQRDKIIAEFIAERKLDDLVVLIERPISPVPKLRTF